MKTFFKQVALLLFVLAFALPLHVFAALSSTPVIFDITPADGFLEALATDGETLYVGGTFTEIDGTARQGFAAFDIETQTLLPLDIEINGDVYALLLDGDTLYVGGDFSDVNNGTSRASLAAFDLNTGTATAFAPVLDGSVSRMLLDNGILYVGGSFSCVGVYVESCDEVDPRNSLASFDVGTGEVTDFDPDISGSVYALDIDGDTLYVGGDFTTVNGGTTRNYVASFDTATGTVTPFNVGGVNDTVTDLIITGNRLFMSGNFTTVNDDVVRNGVAVINVGDGFLADGQATPVDFNVEEGTAYRMYLDEDTLYVVGPFTTVNGNVTRNSMAAFNTDTGIATSFNPNISGGINPMIVDGAGTVYIAGGFTEIGGEEAAGIAYFVDNGEEDPGDDDEEPSDDDDDDDEPSSGGGGLTSSQRRDMGNTSGARDITYLMQQPIALLQQLLEQLIAERG